MKRIILLLLLCAFNSTIYAQERRQNHRVFFEDKDKFSGYVEFNTVVKSTPTRVVVENDPKLVITGYNATDEEIAALNKAGLPLKRFTGKFTPEEYQFYAVGRAYIITRSDYNATEKSTLIIGNGKGTYTTPVFSDLANKRSEEWNKKNKEKTFWETYGGFNAEEVTELHLPELKYQIRQILGKYKSDLEFFQSKITAGTSYANGFNFPGAEEALELAKSHSNESSDHRSKISQLEKLIAQKKKEKEENDKQEKEKEREKEEAAKSATSGEKTEGVATLKTKEGSSSDDDDSDSESKSSSGSSKSSNKKYVPKTAGQMHADLKSMVARNPEMMNDPKVRQQLRHLEVDANREQQTLRDFRTGVYSHGNYQAAASHIATNRRVDAYTKAGGDITDAVSGLVGSLLAESERKSEQRRLAIQAGIDNYYAKKEALNAYHEEMTSQRRTYADKVQAALKNKYDDVISVSLDKIMYNTEVTDDKNSDPHAFKKAQLLMGFLYAYIIEEDKQYGIAADDGTVIYPPQFDAIIPIEFEFMKHHSFLIKIEDKWGEIDPSGRIIEEVKYDGIWYVLTGEKLRRAGDIVELIEPAGKITTLNKDKLANSLAVVINSNENGLNFKQTGGDFYLLDFVNGIYSGGYAKNGNIKPLINYPLNSENAKYIDGVYTGYYSNIFRKDGSWYRLDIETGRNAHYKLSGVPKEFVIAVSNAYLEGRVGEVKWGAINEKNEIVIPFEHTYLKDFKEGMAASDKGAYNEAGKLLFSGNYDSVTGFERGVAFFKYKNPKTNRTEVGLVTEEGKELLRTNGDVYKNDDGWFALAVKFSEDGENRHIDAAIYCYSKVEEHSALYAFATKRAGDLLYYNQDKKEEALKVYSKSFKSPLWEFYLKNMKRSFHSAKGQSQYQTEYFSEVSTYTHLLYTIAWMQFRGQGTQASLVKAQDTFNYLIKVGERIVEEFKHDRPPNRNQKPVDLSFLYNRIGEAYEHIGDFKNAKKYYKLATTRKTESQVKLANTRLNAIKNGTHYKFNK